MIFTEAKIKGSFLIDIKRIKDERGFFGRAFCQREMKEHGLNEIVAQTNLSHNPVKGTLRGLHYQVAPHEESKLVRCTRGSLFDVIVDLRKGSPTFCQWFGTILTADSFTMLYVPEGCAHGFLTLEDNTDIMYQVSNFYAPSSEKGLLWNDPAFGIQWPMEPTLISEKDRHQPTFNLFNENVPKI
ncbi:MAG: dTDP-4-dehydrorhamnose 3,5-epimerase [Chitinophagaceae bacterium]|nr:MAG: dTDP-4-dehydrorhamnose 3,5-epimerase [Chitinophagaceae bacterium]